MYNQYFSPQRSELHIKLTNGVFLTSNTPVCIDLTQMGVYSGLLLRSEHKTTGSEAPNSLTQFLPRYHTGSVDATSLEEGRNTEVAMKTTYYWLLHPDERTYKFDTEYLN